MLALAGLGGGRGVGGVGCPLPARVLPSVACALPCLLTHPPHPPLPSPCLPTTVQHTQLAANADLYVNDAFGTAHRAHASTEGVTKFLKPSVAGFLLQKELVRQLSFRRPIVRVCCKKLRGEGSHTGCRGQSSSTRPFGRARHFPYVPLMPGLVLTRAPPMPPALTGLP